MAYANLINEFSINPIQMFQKFRNFMCKRVSASGAYNYSTTGIGWTLLDSYYASTGTYPEDDPVANDWFVMYSPGEDGLRDLYFKVKLLSGAFEILGYLYWDSSSHTGTQPYGITNTTWTNTSGANNWLWLYGDLDAFFAVSKYGTSTYYSARGGWMPDSPISQAITNYASAISAGASRTLTFASVPGSWAIDTKLFAWDNTNIERVNISGIAGNDVTFTSFANSYSSGADFSLERTDYVNSSPSGSQHDLLIAHNGTKDQVATFDVVSIDNPASGDGLSGLYPAKKAYLTNATTWMGPMKNFLISTALTVGSYHDIGGVAYIAFSVAGAKFLIKEV